MPGRPKLAAVNSEPVGVFKAVSVRDGEALARHRTAVYAIRPIDDATLEVLFEDGLWMLAHQEDIEVESR